MNEIPVLLLHSKPNNFTPKLPQGYDLSKHILNVWNIYVRNSKFKNIKVIANQDGGLELIKIQ